MVSIKTHNPVTPFWYRRISEIIWLITLSLLGLWIVGTYVMPGDLSAQHLLVPFPSLIGALVATIMTVVAYARKTATSSNQLIRLAYALIVLTSLYTVVSTGDTNSPFIALWLLVSIFAAIFGFSMLIPVALTANIYLAYLYMYVTQDVNQLIVYVLAFEIPLIVSFVIWRKGVSSTESGVGDASTVNALARELSQVANKSDIVINAIADGVIAVDSRGTVQLINPAAQQIIGWGKQDALGLDYRSVLQLFNAKNEDVPDELDPVQQCLHTNETVETEDLQLATMSGKKLMISLHVSPIGQIGSGGIIVFRDITAAAKDERQQAEFISTASHEMRTPVAAIEGYIGLALNPATATIDDKAKLYLGKAHESAQHLGRLFQDLLDISKADDGRLANEPRVIDVVAFIRDVTLSFNHMAASKSLILLYKPDTNAPSSQQQMTPAYYSNVDPDHVREVIGNLIENAIKYTKSGDVTVDIKGDDSHVEIAITDTGIGIPSEDIAHLFQKFYRVDNTDTREIGGTGLGLYLCRRLVETMGGRIWVTSDLGRGSTFHVELPRMSNLEAMQAIEASLNETNTPKLHATPSFLPAEEEGAAVAAQAVVTPVPVAAQTPITTSPPPVAQSAPTTPVSPAVIQTPTPAPAMVPQPLQSAVPPTQPQPISSSATTAPGVVEPVRSAINIPPRTVATTGPITAVSSDTISGT